MTGFASGKGKKQFTKCQMLVVNRLKKLGIILFEHFTEGEAMGKQWGGKGMKGSAGKPDSLGLITWAQQIL